MSAPVWRKSSHSGMQTNTDCVELARLPGSVGVRDGRAPDTGYLTLCGQTFAELVARVKRDELNI